MDPYVFNFTSLFLFCLNIKIEKETPQFSVIIMILVSDFQYVQSKE